jgi:hypothetical protein
MNISIKIDHDMADEITRTVLKDCYLNLQNDINTLKRFGSGRTDVQNEDLKDFKKSAKGIKRALRYIMIHEEYKEFIKGAKNEH